MPPPSIKVSASPPRRNASPPRLATAPPSSRGGGGGAGPRPATTMTTTTRYEETNTTLYSAQTNGSNAFVGGGQPQSFYRGYNPQSQNSMISGNTNATTPANYNNPPPSAAVINICSVNSSRPAGQYSLSPPRASRANGSAPPKLGFAVPPSPPRATSTTRVAAAPPSTAFRPQQSPLREREQQQQGFLQQPNPSQGLTNSSNYNSSFSNTTVQYGNPPIVAGRATSSTSPPRVKAVPLVPQQPQHALQGGNAVNNLASNNNRNASPSRVSMPPQLSDRPNPSPRASSMVAPATPRSRATANLHSKLKSPKSSGGAVVGGMPPPPKVVPVLHHDVHHPQQTQQQHANSVHSSVADTHHRPPMMLSDRIEFMEAQKRERQRSASAQQQAEQHKAMRDDQQWGALNPTVERISRENNNSATASTAPIADAPTMMNTTAVPTTTMMMSQQNVDSNSNANPNTNSQLRVQSASVTSVASETEQLFASWEGKQLSWEEKQQALKAMYLRQRDHASEPARGQQQQQQQQPPLSSSAVAVGGAAGGVQRASNASSKPTTPLRNNSPARIPQRAQVAAARRASLMAEYEQQQSGGNVKQPVQQQQSMLQQSGIAQTTSIYDSHSKPPFTNTNNSAADAEFARLQAAADQPAAPPQIPNYFVDVGSTINNRNGVKEAGSALSRLDNYRPSGISTQRTNSNSFAANHGANVGRTDNGMAAPTNTPASAPIPPTPANTPACGPAPPTPANTPACGPTPPTPANTPAWGPTPATPANTPVAGLTPANTPAISYTVTNLTVDTAAYPPTPANTPACGPVPPTPANTPACGPAPVTPANTPTCGPTPPTPANTPACGPMPPTPANTPAWGPTPATPVNTPVTGGLVVQQQQQQPLASYDRRVSEAPPTPANTPTTLQPLAPPPAAVYQQRFSVTDDGNHHPPTPAGTPVNMLHEQQQQQQRARPHHLQPFEYQYAQDALICQWQADVQKQCAHQKRGQGQQNNNYTNDACEGNSCSQSYPATPAATPTNMMMANTTTADGAMASGPVLRGGVTNVGSAPNGGVGMIAAGDNRSSSVITFEFSKPPTPNSHLQQHLEKLAQGGGKLQPQPLPPSTHLHQQQYRQQNGASVSRNEMKMDTSNATRSLIAKDGGSGRGFREPSPSTDMVGLPPPPPFTVGGAGGLANAAARVANNGQQQNNSRGGIKDSPPPAPYNTTTIDSIPSIVVVRSGATASAGGGAAANTNQGSGHNLAVPSNLRGKAAATPLETTSVITDDDDSPTMMGTTRSAIGSQYPMSQFPLGIRRLDSDNTHRPNAVSPSPSANGPQPVMNVSVPMGLSSSPPPSILSVSRNGGGAGGGGGGMGFGAPRRNPVVNKSALYAVQCLASADAKATRARFFAKWWRFLAMRTLLFQQHQETVLLVPTEHQEAQDGGNEDILFHSPDPKPHQEPSSSVQQSEQKEASASTTASTGVTADNIVYSAHSYLALRRSQERTGFDAVQGRQPLSIPAGTAADINIAASVPPPPFSSLNHQRPVFNDRMAEPFAPLSSLRANGVVSGGSSRDQSMPNSVETVTALAALRAKAAEERFEEGKQSGIGYSGTLHAHSGTASAAIVLPTRENTGCVTAFPVGMVSDASSGAVPSQSVPRAMAGSRRDDEYVGLVGTSPRNNTDDSAPSSSTASSSLTAAQEMIAQMRGKARAAASLQLSTMVAERAESEASYHIGASYASNAMGGSHGAFRTASSLQRQQREASNPSFYPAGANHDGTPVSQHYAPTSAVRTYLVGGELPGTAMRRNNAAAEAFDRDQGSGLVMQQSPIALLRQSEQYSAINTYQPPSAAGGVKEGGAARAPNPYSYGEYARRVH